MRIGLTGGIACGKSTVAQLFAKHGAKVVSTDQLAHEILESPAVAPQVRIRFGETVFHADGTVNRPALGKIVFADAGAKKWLEALLHPLVREGWTGQVNASPGALWVVEIPLLFENSLETEFNLTVCVACTQQTQLTRMVKRGLDLKQAQSRLRAQWPLEEKVRRSNCCLFNEGDLLFLERQILLLLSRFPGSVTR
ncbi:MAG: dephospho-CoA kinase [Puniceicoccales bacterium]|nr:dephospho-CoA kinase [Puniceicoccales bacterium]